MKKHHVSRFPWSNRCRLNEEVAMDTVFFTLPGYDQSTCAQLFVGLMSRMMNFYPMSSKAGGYQLKACQDFYREEGAPPVLHRDKAPEQAHEAIVELNRRMMVRDSFAEPGNPNQNPAEALGVKPLKEGIQLIMDRTGADKKAWPWAGGYLCYILARCASPFLNYKTPHSARHGVTPDISNLIGWNFWDKIYFKVDEKAPKSPEAPGYWMGPCPDVGDIMTHWIWSAKTGKPLQRSVIRHADPNKGGIPNLRVQFPTDEDNEEEPEIVDPDNYLDDPSLLCPPELVPRGTPKPRTRTNKHKVKFHDTVEASDEVMQATDPLRDFEDACEDLEDSWEAQDSGELHDESQEDDFGPTVMVDDLSQSHKERRKKLKRSCKAHLLTAATCLSVAAAHGTQVNNNTSLAVEHK